MTQHGYIAHSGGSDFANAMTVGGGDGAEGISDTDSEPHGIGTDFTGADFSAYQLFLSFDTSAITGALATATLTLGLSFDAPSDPMADVVVALFDWGGPGSPTSGDWRTSAQLAALTEVGRISGAALASLSAGDTFDIDIDTSAIDTGGDTNLIVFTDDQATPTTTPTGIQHIFVDGASGASPPDLATTGTGLDPAPPAVDEPVIRVVGVHGTVHKTLTLARVDSITHTKNEPDEAVIIFPKYAYTRDDVHVFADDSGEGDLHEIQIVRNGIVRFWGPAVSAETDSSTGEVTMHCRGVDWYLWTGRFLDGQRTNELTNPSFETGDDTGWAEHGDVVSTVTTADAIRGTHSMRLESITPLGDIYEEQTVSITGTGVGTFITVVFYFKIESIGGHALDRRGLYVEATESGDFKTNNFYAIDEATPLGHWIRAKTTIAVPPLTTWDINIRLYSPPGSILWDDGQVVAMQSISTASITGNLTETVDVSEIVGLILSHVNAKGTDLNIDLDNPTVGVAQVKHIQWADHISWADQMAEWMDRDDCFDYSMVYTETTRTLTLHVTQQGTDRRGDFTLAFPGNVAHHDFTEDGGGTITEDTQLDQDTGDGPDREEGHYQDASLIGGLILQAVDTAPPKSNPSSLDPLARERVTRARRPAQLFTLTLVNGDTEWDELLELGDVCDFDIVDGWATIDGFGRISQLKEYPRNRRLEVTIPKITP